MTIRKAQRNDIPEVVMLLSNDHLGKLREDFRDPLPEKYYRAFEKIEDDPNQELIVAANEKNEIIATFQLTFIQGLTYQGGIRAMIEAVRVREDLRGQKIGEKLIL